MINTVDYASIGRRIKHYRLKCHLTQEQLAERVDVAVSTIAHTEAGSNKPSLPLLMKLTNALNVTLDQLVCDNLPVLDTYLDHDFSLLLKDCSVGEKRVLLDVLRATKRSIRENRTV